MDHRGVFADAGVDFLLDSLQIARRDRAGVREVKAQSVWGDQRACLMHMRAQNVAQRVMQDMGRGMVQHRGVAPRAIHFQRHPRAGPDLSRVAVQQAPKMDDRAIGFAGFGNFEQRPARPCESCRGRRPGRRLRDKRASRQRLLRPCRRRRCGWRGLRIRRDSGRSRQSAKRRPPLSLSSGASASSVRAAARPRSRCSRHQTVEAFDIHCQHRRRGRRPASDRAESHKCRTA